MFALLLTSSTSILIAWGNRRSPIIMTSLPLSNLLHLYWLRKNRQVTTRWYMTSLLPKLHLTVLLIVFSERSPRSTVTVRTRLTLGSSWRTERVTTRRRRWQRRWLLGRSGRTLISLSGRTPFFAFQHSNLPLSNRICSTLRKRQLNRLLKDGCLWRPFYFVRFRSLAISSKSFTL